MDRGWERLIPAMRPLKWKCTNECRNLTSEEVAIVLRTKSLFQMSIEDLRAGLDDLDSGCGHVHTGITLKLAGLYLLAISIKVSRQCTEEVNRLRKQYRSDIPCIELSAIPKPIKSKPQRIGLTCDNIPPQPSTSTKAQVKSTVCNPIKSKTSGSGKRPRGRPP